MIVDVEENTLVGTNDRGIIVQEEGKGRRAR